MGRRVGMHFLAGHVMRHELCSAMRAVQQRELRKRDVRKKTLRAFYISISEMMSAHRVNSSVRWKKRSFCSTPGTFKQSVEIGVEGLRL